MLAVTLFPVASGVLFVAVGSAIAGALLLLAVLFTSAVALVASMFAAASPAVAAGYSIGVSNSWAGNAWREEMVCAIKAQATNTGKYDKVLVSSRNTDAAGQSADIRSFITQKVNAIIVNSGDPSANNAAIKEAVDAGIKVIAVDNAITAPNTTLVANDQVAYGRVGAAALAKAKSDSDAAIAAIKSAFNSLASKWNAKNPKSKVATLK